MPRPILMMFVGPAEIRAIAGSVITALVVASYVSGLGMNGTPVTERGPAGFGAIVVEISSTEV